MEYKIVFLFEIRIDMFTENTNKSVFEIIA